jgi:hypothetical protein
MPFSITKRLLAYVAGGLGLSVLIVTGLLMVQTSRLSSAQDAIKALKELVVAKEARILEDATKIAERDRLIAVQNAAVIKMAEKSVEDEKAYQARLAVAERKAASLDKQIQKIDQSPAVTQEELLGLIRESIAEYQKEQTNG